MVQLQDEFLPQFFVKINGTPASLEFMNDVIEIEVEDNLHLPDMFTLHLYDSGMKWADFLAVGDVIDILARASKQSWRNMTGTVVPLIQGEVTGLEPDLDTGMPTLMVRGYDRAHRLYQGKQTRSFLNSTDSEIVQKIAGEVGLKTEIVPTSVIHEHISQSNQSNMEFLQDRAKCLGYQLYVENNILYFRPGDQDEGIGPTLTWGKDLISFQSTMTTVHQVGEVIVRSWDPVTKQEIVGRATNSNSAPTVKGTEEAQKGFKGSNQHVVSRPVRSQEEADNMAQALLDEMVGDMIQAEGRCLGNPEIKAGKKIQIAGMGQKSGTSPFDGEYFITKVIHTYHAEEEYESHFTIGGRTPKTLSALLSGGGQKKGENDPGRGVRVGLVTNNKDPENMGRIKVKYPGVDDTDESPWVRVAAPMAGAQRGFYYLPEINDEVLITFEQGDIHRPYMVGVLWNGADKPPKPINQVVGGDGKVNQRIITSRSGHQIILDDTGGQEKITISDKKGNQIVIDSAQNSMLIEAKGDLSIKADGKITIKGATIDLN